MFFIYKFADLDCEFFGSPGKRAESASEPGVFGGQDQLLRLKERSPGRPVISFSKPTGISGSGESLLLLMGASVHV